MTNDDAIAELAELAERGRRDPRGETDHLGRVTRERDELARTLAELGQHYEEKVEELSLVRQVGDALGTSLDLPTLCRRALDLIQEAVGPEHCSVMLTEPGVDGLVLAAAQGAYREEAHICEVAAEPVRFEAGEGVAGTVLSTGQAIRIDNAALDERFVPRDGSGVEPVSLLCLPLIARDRTIGVLNLSDSLPDAFELRHERILAIITNSVAMAVENARLFSEVSRSREALASENQSLRQALSAQSGTGGIIGTSPVFRDVLRLIEKVADTSANVLITGESGTGKELVAKTLHEQSRRHQAPFVAINCAALPESLLEAELFGIERGVATGVDARTGTFERADGGTLFLDEIGDMVPTVQAKLLRVLQDRQVTRVGGQRSHHVDVRIVAATHTDLEAAIEQGRFRPDLHYRLRVVRVHLPPLRDRREDIIQLARHFLARFSARHGRPQREVSRTAARALLDHRWPGNVRELEHTIEQAVLLADGDQIEPMDLGLAEASPAGIRLELPETIMDFQETVGEIVALAERRLIERALSETHGNRTQAARAMGMARRTLLYKVKRLGIE